MIKGKIAGIAFGGLAGYLLISKGLNVIRGCVKDICEASKWKAYYSDVNGYHVAPGYTQYTRDIGDDKEIVVEKKDSRTHENCGNEDASGRDWKAELGHAFADAITDRIKGEKGPEEASEGQTEASEEDNSDIFDDPQVTDVENEEGVSDEALD